MKTITVRRLELQFRADQLTSGNLVEQADQAIALVNRTLQQELLGFGAQLIAHRDEIEVESGDSAA